MNQNILVNNITNFPNIVNVVTISADYLSVYTQSYSNSAYVMMFTITVYTPDKRASLFVSAIIYINHYFPGKIANQFNGFKFLQVDNIHIYENLILELGNYFINGS